ncbi:MAG: hypothetical protein KIT63_24045 [Rhodoferax sp.]|nr:hypothetical protein [Rhodoferax sp.]
MSRPIRAFMLMLAFVWQAAALFAPSATAAWAAELEHKAFHTQGDGHHHHDDQSLHVDDNDSVVMHQHADTGSHSLGLWQDTALRLLPVPRASVVPWADMLRPPPLLDGLLRPPKSAA